MPTLAPALPTAPVETTAPPAAGPTGSPSLTTNGPYLVYLRGPVGAQEIVLLDADGKGRKTFPSPMQSIPVSLSNLVSPDGQWMAYYTGSAGQAFGHIGKDTADLTLNLMSLSDGNSQAVTRLLSQDYPDIFVKAAQELNQPDITADQLQNAFLYGITQSIDWSPDGRYLAFAGEMDGLSSDLYLYDTVSKTVKRLSSGPEEVEWISWSPDGKWVLDGSAYAVGEGMTYDIFATSVDGASVRQILENTPTILGPQDWLNTHQFFESNSANGPGLFDLELVDINTGGKVEVWNGSYESFAFVPFGNWAALYANTPIWPYPYTGGSFVPGPFLINLTNLKQTRIMFPTVPHIDFEALNSPPARMFLMKSGTDQSLSYVSSDGTLTPAGVQADLFSVSPDQHYWVAASDKLQVFAADGSHLRDVQFQACGSGCAFQNILWRPDSSGLFFSDSSENLYSLDLLTGNPIHLDDTLSSTSLADYVWVSNQPK